MTNFYVDNTRFYIEDYFKNNFEIKSYDKIYNVEINNDILDDMIKNNYLNGDIIIIDNYFKDKISMNIDENSIS